MNKKVIIYIVSITIMILNLIIYVNINSYIDILNRCFNQNITISNMCYSSICFIIALISILIIICIKLVIYYEKDEIKGIELKKEDGTHGTADWMAEDDIEKILAKNDTPGIILGKRNNDIIKLPFDSYFNKNIAVFGSSGSMKTIGFLITNLLELFKYRKSIIVTDAKGEIYRKTSQLFRNDGYIVKVFNLNNMENSDRWNPLGENEDITDIQTSSNVIISGTQNKNGKDDFWPRAEENLLKAFEFYFAENDLERNTLTNIYKIIANGDIATLDTIFKRLPQESPARMSYNIFASGSDTIKASVLTGLGTRLQAFQNKKLQEITNYTDIDLTLPGKKPCIYYVITSDMDSSRDFLISLFFTFLFIKLVKYADSTENGKCKNEVFFFLDEFANICQIPEFNKKISTVRSRGIALIPILQNIGQLNNRYPNGLADEILGNTDIKLNLGTTDILTAKYFCDLLGVATAETQSIKKRIGIDGELEFGQKNISTLERNLLNADEIIRIPSTKLMVIIRGNKPLLLQKMIYTEHPISKKLQDASVLTYIPEWNNNIVVSNDIIGRERAKNETKEKNIRIEKECEDITFENF